MNLIINIFLLILVIIIFYEVFIEVKIEASKQLKNNENFEIIIPDNTSLKISGPILNDVNFMFYQGTKPKGKAITSKPELKDNLNELVNYALSLKNCLSFTNEGDFYENFDLCYNKGPLNSQGGEPYDGTYIKSQIFEDYLINIC